MKYEKSILKKRLAESLKLSLSPLLYLNPFLYLNKIPLRVNEANASLTGRF